MILVKALDRFGQVVSLWRSSRDAAVGSVWGRVLHLVVSEQG